MVLAAGATTVSADAAEKILKEASRVTAEAVKVAVTETQMALASAATVADPIREAKHMKNWRPMSVFYYFSASLMSMFAFTLILLGARAMVYKAMDGPLKSGALNIDTAVLARSEGFALLLLVTAFSYAVAIIARSNFVVHAPKRTEMDPAHWFKAMVLEVFVGGAAQCVGGTFAVITLWAYFDARYLNNAIPRVVMDADPDKWRWYHAMFMEMSGYIAAWLVAGYFNADQSEVAVSTNDMGGAYNTRTIHSFRESALRMVPVGYAMGALITMFRTGACLDPMYALATRIGVSWIYIRDPSNSGGGITVVEPGGNVSHNIWDVDMFTYFVAFFMAQFVLYVSRGGSVYLTYKGRDHVAYKEAKEAYEKAKKRKSAKVAPLDVGAGADDADYADDAGY
jgi:hypothetical protein